jgi:hypothetical protein
MKEKFRDHKFRSEALDLIETCNTVIEDSWTET